MTTETTSTSQVLPMLNICSAPAQLADAQPAALPDKEVAVWLAEIGAENSLSDWETLLSPDERERAHRFHFPEDWRRYVYGRGLLRCLLGSYLRLDPASLRFTYSEHGKPELASGVSSRLLHFNLSHSGAKLVLVLAWDRRVGADVEEVTGNRDLEQIANRFFSPAERQALLAVDLSARKQAFYLCWSRKEAFLKASGDGLSLPLDQFDVSLQPGQVAALLATRPDASEASRWSMHNLDMGPDYAAAVVVEKLTQV